MIIISIILVVLIFGSLIFVHELGHFLAARRNGVEVDEFGFGFPPRLIGIQKGKTIYSLNLLPLGGFVRLKGEDQSDKSPGSFGSASIWSKTKILLAGVGMNALMAYVLLLILCLVGLPAIFTTGFVLPRPSSTSAKQVMIVALSDGSPAAQAGLVKGDVVLSADHRPLHTEEDLINFTKAHAAQRVLFEVKHAKLVSSYNITLNSQTKGQRSGYLGITPLQVYTTQFGWRSIWVAASLVLQMIGATLAGFAGAIAGLFTGHAGQSAAGVTGPVGIVVILSNIIYLGVTYVMFFMATISVSLAVINALPIPAIDGGRLYLIWFGKLRGRAVSPELEARIHTIGFMTLIALMVLITFLDVRRLRH